MSETNQNANDSTGIPNKVYESDHVIISSNSGGPEDVCVYVGTPPEDETPAVESAREMYYALGEFLESVDP